MSQYYNSRRMTGLFAPGSHQSYRLSRSKLDLFLNCPRCFYLDRRLGVAQPPGFPFSLNSAVDALLKKEFDIHRAGNTPHPLMEKYGLDAVPLTHELMDEWRDSLKGGIKFLHKPTNFLVTGGVDDIWINSKGEYIIVDYKSTAKMGNITSLDAEWHIGYKRQMEVYQWLFKMNGFKVSDTGYFVYCNGDLDKKAFDARLDFKITLIPYKGNTDWIEKALADAHKCLSSEETPKAHPDCDYCSYRKAATEVEYPVKLQPVMITDKAKAKVKAKKKPAIASQSLF